MRRRRGCVVDGVSTGRDLARELAMLGVECAHVNSAGSYLGVPVEEFVREGSYDRYFDGRTDLPDLVPRLKEWGPDFVVAGSEPGVALCDALCGELGLPGGNAASTTAWRRDKYAMHERLRGRGLRHAAQLKTAHRAEAARWLDEHGTYPVVVKPLDSTGSDGVSVCASRDEALRAFLRVLGRVNRLGRLNDEVLLQEFLDGRQYFVNAVSWEGEHFVTDIWRHDRRQGEHGRFLFENMTLQPSDGEREVALAAYTRQVLDALGFRFGAAHCEVMWTNGGPVLIEANARLMGASIERRVLHRALGYTQARILAEVCADPGSFRRWAGTRYELRAHVAEASFVFTRSGRLIGFPGRPGIEGLASFHSFVGVPAIGARVRRTDNTLGEPGYAYFAHHDREQVLRDARAVLDWQRADTVFDIEEDT
ncbi:ATP-grasp domain-containing protein [Streptomyces sp. URMC 129]|uniref:ATP-grasp domain-containing protein n=1 Tax=Streptomyces sp. URMC 129 TaxID=3423407 RepID=UPI003F1B237E